MIFHLPRFFPIVALVAGMSALTSCAVQQEASLRANHEPAPLKKAGNRPEAAAKPMTWREKQQAAAAEREKAKLALEQEKAKQAAADKKAAEIAERKLAATRKAEEARERRLADAKAKADAKLAAQAEKERLAQAKLEQEAAAAALAEKEQLKAAKLAAREKARLDRAKRRQVDVVQDEPPTEVTSPRKGGLFSRFQSDPTPKEFRNSEHQIYINSHLLHELDASNAKIEISLNDQKARVYRTGAGRKDLVIETQVSTGKPGHTTPTGTYKIQEMLVDKQSTLYGDWLSSSGVPVDGSSDIRKRPRGGAAFVGADMPYWMRITGGIGLHVGYVPGHPASHGCIRVPQVVQPLIYSKVGVGTPVTITR